MADDEWYYAQGSEAVGPFTLHDLKAGLAKFPDWQDVRVWRDGFDGWQRAGDLAEFAEPAVAPGPSPKAPPEQSRPPAKQAARQKPARRRSIGVVLGGVVLLAVVATAGFFGKLILATVHELVPKPSRSARPVAAPVDKTLEDRIARNFEGFEATLPKKVDDLTTLVSAKHEGATVTFGYRVDVDGSRLGEQVKAKVREIATKDICRETRSREILDLGGAFHLDYVDKNEKPVTAVDIAKSNCS